jgi:hypothetical protein
VLNDKHRGVIERTRANQVISVLLTELKDKDIVTKFIVPTVLGCRYNFIDNFCVGSLAEDITPSIEFQEKVSNDSGRYDALVRLILENPNLGSEYLLVRAHRFKPFIRFRFLELSGLESREGRRRHSFLSKRVCCAADLLSRFGNHTIFPPHKPDMSGVYGG